MFPSSFEKPKKQEVIAALENLRNIPRPHGDNEGDAINSDTVYRDLLPSNQELVDLAEELANQYVRGIGYCEVNRRSLTELNKEGYFAFLDQDQYDPYRLVGQITIGEWVLDISDPYNESSND